MHLFMRPQSYELCHKIDGSPQVIAWDDGVGKELPIRSDLVAWSDNRFGWGKGLASCLVTALAILAHATGDDTLALVLRVRYAKEVISEMNGRCRYTIHREEVYNWILSTLRENWLNGVVTFCPLPE